MFYNFFAKTLRALGDSKSPLYFLFVASGLNIVLDMVLILFTPLGVAGAAWATPLSWLGAMIPVAVAYILAARTLRKKIANE